MADNYSIQVHSDKLEVLELALKAALLHHSSNVKSYCVHPDWGLVFFWTKEPNFSNSYKVVSLKEPWDFEKCLNFTKHWLKKQQLDDYDCWEDLFKKNENFEKPDPNSYHTQTFNNNISTKSFYEDVIFEKGFYLTTGDFWGSLSGNDYAICAITPSYLFYGK